MAKGEKDNYLMHFILTTFGMKSFRMIRITSRSPRREEALVSDHLQDDWNQHLSSRQCGVGSAPEGSVCP